MYTHDRLWPEMKDLASDLGSECVLLSPDSGGNCFDESCSSIWASVADAFPGYDVPMACQSVTVELRGEIDVSYEISVDILSSTTIRTGSINILLFRGRNR